MGAPMEDSPLFKDIKAAERVERSLALFRPEARGEIKAAERGRRTRPDGTVEEYERVEFRRESR
jgi:hypothetical protein